MTVRRGFTMTEILIVIALIVLIIAMAVPVFSLITGTRSVDAAENLVAAMLGQARAMAMDTDPERGYPPLVGVAFFRDPDNDRTAMAFVTIGATQSQDTTPEPSGLEQYKAWSQFQTDGTTATQYKKGHVVYHLVPNPTAGRMTMQKYVCIADPGASTPGNAPPNATYWDPQGGVFGAGGTSAEELDIIPGAELQYLPPGVGAQLINNPAPDTTPAPPSPNDRYVRLGAIMFDRRGAVVHIPYDISNADANGDGVCDNRLADMAGRTPTTSTPIPVTANNPTYTQLGVVLYDLQVFRNEFGQDADRLDPVNDGGGYTEANEESWLDQNSLQLLINRYNGTLIRGE